MLNLTNDGWFGQTSGPYQHFAQARLRSIEEGLPLVRVANTGISAVTDGYGRTLASLPLGREGVLDSGLPRAGPATLYSRLGDLVYAALLAGFLLMARLPPRD
jgi:apolipoprotein N-acyltransferase